MYLLFMGLSIFLCLYNFFSRQKGVAVPLACGFLCLGILTYQQMLRDFNMRMIDRRSESLFLTPEEKNIENFFFNFDSAAFTNRTRIGQSRAFHGAFALANERVVNRAKELFDKLDRIPSRQPELEFGGEVHPHSA
jgi:hypothetical protein